jgi:phosphate uptake regulator
MGMSGRGVLFLVQGRKGEIKSMKTGNMIVVALLVATIQGFAQQGNDLQDMGKQIKEMGDRFIEGIKKSDGNAGDKAIEGIIQMATPEADENVRKVQRDAIKFLLDPNQQRSQQHFDSMLRNITGQGADNAGQPATGNEQTISTSQSPPEEDPDWQEYVSVQRQVMQAKHNLAAASETYQPGSARMKELSEELDKQVISLRNQVPALRTRLKAQVKALTSEYKHGLKEMKDVHPEMRALDSKIKRKKSQVGALEAVMSEDPEMVKTLQEENRQRQEVRVFAKYMIRGWWFGREGNCDIPKEETFRDGEGREVRCQVQFHQTQKEQQVGTRQYHYDVRTGRGGGGSLGYEVETKYGYAPVMEKWCERRCVFQVGDQQEILETTFQHQSLCQPEHFVDVGPVRFIIEEEPRRTYVFVCRLDTAREPLPKRVWEPEQFFTEDK